MSASLLAFRVACEVQSLALWRLPVYRRKKLFAGSPLTETPTVELANRAQLCRHSLPAQLGHAQRGCARKTGMYALNRIDVRYDQASD